MRTDEQPSLWRSARGEPVLAHPCPLHFWAPQQRPRIGGANAIRHASTCGQLGSRSQLAGSVWQEERQGWCMSTSGKCRRSLYIWQPAPSAESGPATYYSRCRTASALLRCYRSGRKRPEHKRMMQVASRCLILIRLQTRSQGHQALTR